MILAQSDQASPCKYQLGRGIAKILIGKKLVKEQKLMTTATIDIGTLITRNPKICGNRPCIAGTRMTVSRIAMLWQQGLSAESIQNEYPHLELAKIYAALAYYHANRADIDRVLTQDQADYEHYRNLYQRS